MLQEIKDEEMYVLVAPDGTWQAMTLSPTYEACVGLIRMLHKAGMAKSYHELVKEKGCEIAPVTVSAYQHLTAEQGFEKAKQKLRNNNNN